MQELNVSIRMDEIDDNLGAEGCRSNHACEIPAYCWSLCDEEAVRLHMDFLAPCVDFSQCSDSIHPWKPCRHRRFHAEPSSRTLPRMAGTIGRSAARSEEGFRPCRSQICFQSDEASRDISAIHRPYRSHLADECGTGASGSSFVGRHPDGQRPTSRCTGEPTHLHNDHGNGSSLARAKVGSESIWFFARRLSNVLYLLCRRYRASSDIKTGSGGHDTRCHHSPQRHRLEHWSRKDTLDELTAITGRRALCFWKQGTVGRDTYLCGHSLGSSWWSMGSRNLPDGASQQGIRQVEPTPDLCMDPESKKNSVACKDCLVFISLELEYMDTDKRAKKQDCELERQSCSQGSTPETSSGTARRPMVEIYAQSWASFDRQVRYRLGAIMQGALASLGRTRCSDGGDSTCGTGSPLSRIAVVALASTSAQTHKGQVDRTSPTKIQNIQVGGAAGPTLWRGIRRRHHFQHWMAAERTEPRRVATGSGERKSCLSPKLSLLKESYSHTVAQVFRELRLITCKPCYSPIRSKSVTFSDFC
jgi:hypothetical protein